LQRRQVESPNRPLCPGGGYRSIVTNFQIFRIRRNFETHNDIHGCSILYFDKFINKVVIHETTFLSENFINPLENANRLANNLRQPE
ncbi:MAG TPA: hypothetical protein DCE76_03780, partial [Anaerolineaceae bacterium]|nr:hypothetical protein [Anaerolineaceae bacterium]